MEPYTSMFHSESLLPLLQSISQIRNQLFYILSLLLQPFLGEYSMTWCHDEWNFFSGCTLSPWVFKLGLLELDQGGRFFQVVWPGRWVDCPDHSTPKRWEWSQACLEPNLDGLYSYVLIFSWCLSPVRYIFEEMVFSWLVLLRWLWQRRVVLLILSGRWVTFAWEKHFSEGALADWANDFISSVLEGFPHIIEFLLLHF